MGAGSSQQPVEDEPFWKSLSEIPNLHAVTSGHDHGNEWCKRVDGVVFCFAKHSGCVYPRVCVAHILTLKQIRWIWRVFVGFRRAGLRLPEVQCHWTRGDLDKDGGWDKERRDCTLRNV